MASFLLREPDPGVGRPPVPLAAARPRRGGGHGERRGARGPAAAGPRAPARLPLRAHHRARARRRRDRAARRSRSTRRAGSPSTRSRSGSTRGSWTGSSRSPPCTSRSSARGSSSTRSRRARSRAGCPRIAGAARATSPPRSSGRRACSGSRGSSADGHDHRGGGERRRPRRRASGATRRRGSPCPTAAQLECTFAIEARFFAELDEARAVGERSRDFEKLGGEIRRTLLRSFGALVVLAALVAAALGILIARRTTRRVSDLVLATRRLAAGDLAVQVDPGRSSDEVAGLARAFNAMVREVRESRDRIVYLEKISGWQEVARRLAHEIKNPLTPMKLAFQQLEARWKQSPARSGRPGDREGGEGRGRDRARRDRHAAAARRGVLGVREAAGGARRAGRPRRVRGRVPAHEPAARRARRRRGGEGRRPRARSRSTARSCAASSRTCCANAIEAALPGRARIHLGVARTRDRAVLTVGGRGARDRARGARADLRSLLHDQGDRDRASASPS